LTVKDEDKDKDFGRNWSQGQSKNFKCRLNSKDLDDYNKLEQIKNSKM